MAIASAGSHGDAAIAAGPPDSPKTSVVTRSTAYTPTLVMMANSAATGAHAAP